MREGGIDLSGIKYVPDNIWPAIKSYTISKYDLFISVAGTLGIVGSIPESLDGANLTENADKICNIKCSKSFLQYHLQSELIRNRIKDASTVCAQPKLAIEQIKSFPVPIPPLSEQQKIANILTTVDDYISETEALIEKTKVLKQGLMQQLLTKGIGHTEFKDTEIGRIPVKWEVNRLEDITKLMGGFAFKSKEFCENGIIVIKINNITDEGFNYDNKTYYPLDKIDEYRSFIPDVDDILMTMTGNIGRVAYVKSENLPCLVNQRVGRVKVKNIAQTNPLYLYHYFNTPFYRQLLADMSAGGAQQNISTAQINSTLIPLPPLPEQRQIAAILTSVDDQIDTYQAKLASLTKLKSGLMQQLLTGKIRVKV